MKLNKQQFAAALLGLVNADTNEPIETTFTEIKMESSDPAVAEIKDADSDGDVDVVALAAGKTTIIVSAVADYIDPKTNERVVAGKSAEPVEIEVAEDPTKTKLVVSFTAENNLPVVEEAGGPGLGENENNANTDTTIPNDGKPME